MAHKPSLPQLLRKKRDGEILSEDEIQAFVDHTVAKTAQDCQIGAMLMAIYLKGMTAEETIQLTSALMHSGDVLTWPAEWRELLADKHSTGGVGDKVSLPLAPALAACGLKVPMLSGRGLDFTGGTLDKLESIPGYSVLLDHGAMERALREAGCFIAGQTDRLVPGDRELYKRRDVTATVDSDPLVIASIVSKKAAEGVRSLVMDIKVGSGGVCKSVEAARRLANMLIRTAEGLGVRTRAVLTRMAVPIGRAVGNALEVAEAVECLRGEDIAEDLEELVTTLGGELLHMQGRASSLSEGRAAISKSLKDGSALACFERMLRCQGVGEETARELCHGDMWAVLPHVTPEHVTRLETHRDGFVVGIDALEVALVCRELGAGRSRADQELDLRVGVRILRSVGAQVRSGEPWLEVHHAQAQLPQPLRSRLEETLTIADTMTENKHRVIEII